MLASTCKILQRQVFEKFISAYEQQIALQIMLLVYNLHEDGRNFGSAHAICNLHSCYIFVFVLMLHEKYTRFQPIRRA